MEVGGGESGCESPGERQTIKHTVILKLLA